MTFPVTSLVFYLVWTFVQCYNQRDRLFLLQKTSEDEIEPVLVATWRDGDIPTGCEILTDKEVVDNVVSTSDPSKIRSLSEDDMKLLLDDCSQFSAKEEKVMESMVEASTRMSIRDVVRNSHRRFWWGNREDTSSQNQNQGRKNSGRMNDSRVNGVETTTSISYPKSSRRENVSSTANSGYSTLAPRSAMGRYPTKDFFDARAITINRYATEPTRSGIGRENARRTTNGRYPTESPSTARERDPTRENGRRTTIGRYPTVPTRSAMERNPARESARRTTINGYSTEPSRRIVTGRTRGFSVKTTTNANDLETSTTSSSTVPGYNGIPIILPGTKWCGAGSIAEHEKDLGRSEETDKCCRAHDHCEDTLAPGETRGNLTNDSSFTLLNCQCDEEFYDCLDSSNSIVSNTVGNLYFNILARKCYKKDHPLKCKKYYTIFQITCREYENDTSQKRSYNWYPAKRYRKIFTK